jgi:Tol biopolymer transport system component
LRYELWVMRADGTGARRLARGTTPSWSPDGQTIAFVWIGTRAEDDRSGIATIRADGSELRPLTALMSHPNRRGPSWSPDGRRITFASWGWFEEPSRLYTMNADGTDLHRQTRLEPFDAAWSPDGTRIAFATVGALYTVGPDGRGLRRVFGQGCGWSLAWSTDGTRIVCDAGPGFAIVGVDGHVWLRPGLRVPGDGEAFESSASLSPDGRRVAFERSVGETTEVYVALADAADARRLATGWGPAWSPDGTHVAFSDGGDVYVIDVDGTSLTNLTKGLKAGRD